MLLSISIIGIFCLFGATEVYSDNCDKSGENKYSKEANEPPAPAELTDEELFKRGHMKPFGSHRPPDHIAEEIPFMISPEDFYMNYVVKHKPVVLKGAAKNWPAYRLWTDEYMKKKYGNYTVRMETKDDDKFNIPPTENFSEFLDKYQRNDSRLYLVDEVYPEMRKEIVLPLCLRCEEIDRFFFVSFLWYSGGGTMSTVHIDTDENLLCVLKGHKRTIMVSPIYSKDVYADESKIIGVSPINSSAVDFEKYPRVKNVRYWVANADEGDCYFIPQMWWHQVYSRPERQVAVALWWKSKPFWKSVQNTATKVGSRKMDKAERKGEKAYSFAEALKEYEEWVGEVSDKIPPIRCKEQQVLMSNYHWETDKIENAPTTLGDGGDIEEEIFKETDDISEIKEKKKELEENEGRRACDFDITNKKSPCYFKRGEEEDPKYIRYMLDYCNVYEDRGCVINKPQLLNKLDGETLDEIKSMKPLLK